jgi:Uma2 family endonuclease
MPVVLGETPVAALEVYPPRKPWTRDDVEVLEKSGAWDGRHYELVQGELINKMGKHLRHSLATMRVLRALVEIFGWGVVLQEACIDVAPEDHPTSDPEPDVIVLKTDPSKITGREPAAADVTLLVEVSDTTLGFDFSVKASLYARAGIPEYWVLDLNGGRVIVHRDPQRGRYKSIVSYSGDERVSPLTAPEKLISVAELLG